MLRVTLTLSCLLVCQAAFRADEAREPPAKMSLEEARKKFAAMPFKTLPIAEPADLKEWGYFKDGGSMLLRIKDAKGKEHTFRTHKSPSATLMYSGPGGGEPSPLKEAGAEMQEVYGFMVRWITKNVPNAKEFFADGKLPKTADPAGLALIFDRMEERVTGLRK